MILTHAPSAAVPDDAFKWAQILARYRKPSATRSIFEIAVSFVPLVALWVLAWWMMNLGYWWLTLLIAVPASGFLVRLFMIQHDCGHGAFFRHRLANDWIGRAIGVLTLTPYDFWRETHAEHHAGSGNLDRRGIGDVEMLTVREYLALPRLGRLRYRLYRHPLVLFGLMRAGWRPWISAMATNFAIAAIAATLIWFIGFWTFMLVHLPIVLMAAAIGVWLFYVQHQFESTQWAHERDWNQHETALHGSSYYELPHVLRWFTANIGMHHMHHLCCRIPFYRLPRAMRDYPELRGISRLTLMQSFRCVRLRLWDESQRRLVSFRAVRRAANTART
jgi:omega-6 fatty acid desaturase (delta-12 desaturase)